MKRNLWTGGRALALALALSACEGIIPSAESGIVPLNGPVEYTEDGRPLVQLTVHTGEERADGGARALSTDLAKAAINYYEVLFLNDEKYYHAAAYKGNPLTLRVPADTYTTDGTGKSAVVLAGVYSGTGVKTLLAMGKLTDPADGNIAGKTSVTFTLTALSTNVTDSPSSTFQVTSGAPAFGKYQKPVYNGVEIPAFKVQKNAAIVATYSIGGLDTDAAAPGSGGACTFGSMLITGIATVTYWAISATDITTAAIPMADEPYVNSPSPNAQVDSGAIELKMTTPNADCAYLINFSLPVILFSYLNKAPANGWVLRGGLQNQLPDSGTTTSVGGGIVLLVNTNSL